VGGGDVFVASLGVGLVWVVVVDFWIFYALVGVGFAGKCMFVWLWMDGRIGGKHVPLPLCIREVLQLSKYLFFIRWPNNNTFLKILRSEGEKRRAYSSGLPLDLDEPGLGGKAELTRLGQEG